MRIRIPRRFLLLGVLLCSLAFVTSFPSPTYAKPYPWNPDDGPAPGDGDGPVVKGGTSTTLSATITTTQSGQATRVSTTVSSVWRNYLTVLRLGLGWRWLW